MVSLQSPPSARKQSRQRSEADVRRDLSTRRPLVLTATLGGAVAAAGPLLVCLAVAVVGWFLTDAGGHGAPSGALRVGALGWLTAHGSGVTVEQARITAIPLGLTLLCAWSVWRVGHRVGESISGHGPDAERIADGERDWTVPVAAGLFAVGYVLVAVAAVTLAATPETAPATGRVVAWALLLSLLVGAPALARGSGRAAIWLPSIPAGVRAAAHVCRAILVAWLATALVVLVAAFAVDVSTAANVVSQLGADAGDTLLISLLTIGLLPNAALFSGAYLLGPGFAVGTGSVVSPGAVAFGPLPMFPLLAALPDTGPTPGWTQWLMVAPVLVAGLAAARVHHVRPASSWDRAAVRGCGGGLAAGLAVGILSGLAGGAVGPGRMADVGPFAFDVFLHSVSAFGVGGLLGALAVTAWQLRGPAATTRARRWAGRLVRR